MLGFNPNNFMVVDKRVRIRRVRGPEGVKGSTGGLFRSHCYFLTTIILLTLIIIIIYQQLEQHFVQLWLTL